MEPENSLLFVQELTTGTLDTSISNYQSTLCHIPLDFDL